MTGSLESGFLVVFVSLLGSFFVFFFRKFLNWKLQTEKRVIFVCLFVLSCLVLVCHLFNF